MTAELGLKHSCICMSSLCYHLYFIQILGIKVETKVLSQEYRGSFWSSTFAK